jgi:nitroimidazol reductase NimA-like FMN-containing flavoprotein (pyridoxamine 5'-phosphate oxidase superfamily)
MNAMEKELSYSEAYSECEEFLSNNHTLVLATSYNNKVTARSMSFVNIGLNLYCQTDKRFEKYAQITANPSVAVCCKNFQIEAIAEELGHPFDEWNSEFLKQFKKVHPGSFKAYSESENEVVFRLNPTKIVIWKYIEGKPVRDIIDLVEQKTWREEYNS